MVNRAIKHYILFAAALFAANLIMALPKYETVKGDPLNVRIYTLDNGLKVYLSVNKSEPRIQTYIGVRVGSKNDPAETTGLAHYFEHLMFKGTDKFGTSNYTAEKPLLDKIENLYEVYRKTKDSTKRKEIYAQIDSISQDASKISIAGEYDKLMSAIGANGTNAFTSYDVTAYIENIPSNEIDNWAKIQSDRFTNPVIRLFHTELETVYEEYNMSLTRDGRKVNNMLMSTLFPNHPYGTQTIIGTGEHLKNPSIKNIREYFETYYVPNNMAIIMAGDFDPDNAIQIVSKYFGGMKPKPVPQLKTTPEMPIAAPIEKTVVGLESEQVTIAFRLPGASNKDADMADMAAYLLHNGNAGIIDLNLVQKQKILQGGSSVSALADYSMFQLYGKPKEGQTLDQVRDLLLQQLEMLRKGDFDDNLLKACVNNFKLDKYYQQQETGYAAYLMLNSFVNGTDWKDDVNKLSFQASITKKDIMEFSNKYLTNNYVTVFKTKGKPETVKIEKPQITPVSTNRDMESAFLKLFKETKVKPIEPVFVDFAKDMSILKTKNLDLLYKQNVENPIFSLYYVFDMGNNNDKALGTAFSYLNYLGTSKQTAEQIKSELFSLACSFGVSSTDRRVYVYVNGLSENFEKAMTLLENRLADAKADQDAYKNLTNDIIKARADAKLNQNTIFSRLRNYAQWGAKSAVTNLLSESELRAMNPDDLVVKIKNLKNYQHRIIYYGPLKQNEALAIINKKHAVADKLQAIPQATVFTEQETSTNTVLLANYEAKQIYMSMVSKGGKFDMSIEPSIALYNGYFGSGLNSIVFQEMRESRGLAYSAWTGYQRPGTPDRSYYLSTFIATQNDKMKEAGTVFAEILNNMPESENALRIAKENIITTIRTARTLREDVLWTYLNNIEFGYKTDPRKELFEKIPAMTIKDVTSFQEKYIKNKPYTYCILGDTNDLDQTTLSSFGNVKQLSLEELFGY